MDNKYRSRRFLLALLWTVGTLLVSVAVVFHVGSDPLIGLGITAGLVLGGYGFTRTTDSSYANPKKPSSEKDTE